MRITIPNPVHYASGEIPQTADTVQVLGDGRTGKVVGVAHYRNRVQVLWTTSPERKHQRRFTAFKAESLRLVNRAGLEVA